MVSSIELFVGHVILERLPTYVPEFNLGEYIRGYLM